MCGRLIVILLIAVGWPVLHPRPASAQTACGRVQMQSLPRYTLQIAVEPEKRRLAVEGTIHLPPALAAEGLEFKLRRDMGTPQVRVTGPAAAAGPAVLVRGPDATEGADVTWRIVPSRPAPAGAPVILHVRYAGGDTASLNYYAGPEIVFANGGSTAWYPQFHGSRAVGELTLRVPPAFTVVAGAEKGVGRAGRARTFSLRPRHPTHFEFTAGPFQVRRGSGPVPVSLYLLKDRPFADDLVKTAQGALRVLEAEFGPYPYESFAVVEAPQGPAQRSGFSGAGYEGYMLMRTDWLDVKRADPGFFGHEIGHGWWGVSVQKTGDRGEYMLDEALAQYGGLRVVEALQGPAAAERFRRGIGGLGGGRHAVRLIAAGFDRPVADLPHAPEWYALSDGKGYLVYDMLARHMGRDRLQRAFQRITCEHAHGEVDWATFLSAIREAAGKDIEPFLAQWMDRPGVPVLTTAWSQQAGQATVTVEQRESAHGFEMPLRLQFEDGRAEMVSMTVAGERSTARFDVRGTVRAVELDPLYTVFHATPAEWEDAAARSYVTRGELLWDNSRAEEARAELAAGLAALQGPDNTTAEFAGRLYLGWILEDAGQADEAMRQYETAAALPVRDPDLLSRLFFNIARAWSARGDKARTRQAAEAAIAVEKAAGAPTSITDRARALLAK